LLSAPFPEGPLFSAISEADSVLGMPAPATVPFLAPSFNIMRFRTVIQFVLITLAAVVDCGASGSSELPAAYFVEKSQIASKILEQFNCSMSAALQFTNRPSNNEVVVLSPTPSHNLHIGLGAQIHMFWAPNVINAFFAGRRVVLGEGFKIPWNYGCPGHPGSGDVLAMANFDGDFSHRKDLDQNSIPHMFAGNNVKLDHSKAQLTCHGKTLGEDELISAGYAFWLRYTPGITAMINARKLPLKPLLSNQYHGVHYRGGDKLAFESSSKGPEDLREDSWVKNIIKVFYERDSAKKIPIYLDSDVCSVVQNLTSMLRKEGISSASLWDFPCTQKPSPYIQNGMKAAVKVVGHNQKDFNRARTCDETVNFFAALELYREASDVYLAKGSNVGRAVIYLRMADGSPGSTIHLHDPRHPPK